MSSKQLDQDPRLTMVEIKEDLEADDLDRAIERTQGLLSQLRQRRDK